MNHGPIEFVVPTYRLREVGETIRHYDEHFFRNGQALDLIVFDDSSPAMQDKYYSSLENVATHNNLYYVGPREKEAFVGYLNRRLRDRKLEPLVRNLFRPSYGGNRNVALMYTLGKLVVSADDDMRPYALIENAPEALNDGEISRGKLLKTDSKGYTKKSFDILAGFLDVLGKPVSELPANYLRGRLIRDTSMDLDTNTSNCLSRENTLLLEEGALADDVIVKVAQTFRSGTNDIDAIDYVEMALDDDAQTHVEELNDQYVLVNFRPVVTKENWRIDCGVAGYDNRLGLPPFFPTRLRFEDYIYRLWVQQPGVASAHVDAAQTHIKSNYMRNPLASEVFNEEVCNLLKRKIKASVTSIDELSIAFDYEGEVTLDDSDRILSRISKLHQQVVRCAGAAKSQERGDALQALACNMERSFYGFEADFFQQNLIRIVDDVISQFKGSLELWPTLVEIAYLEKQRHGFPIKRVNNVRRLAGRAA